MYFLPFITMLVHCQSVVSDSTTVSSISKNNSELNYTYKTLNDIPQTQITLLEMAKNESGSTERDASKPRYKRQQSSGAGKFTEAAQMPQVKALRIFLTMFKNLWAPSHTGGTNPFHPYVPKPIVQLYKQRVVQFFFPDIGDEGKKVK